MYDEKMTKPEPAQWRPCPKGEWNRLSESLRSRHRKSVILNIFAIAVGGHCHRRHDLGSDVDVYNRLRRRVPNRGQVAIRPHQPRPATLILKRQSLEVYMRLGACLAQAPFFLSDGIEFGPALATR